ncbi:MAG: hypothetical protein CO186_11760 [Zetaproteobacteria bacterium CG_4_9_14_3_um_filter_49_83]|nr:MAG: hypothetical protein COW62_12750 [Zetaproteobacteria bacterium CG17_big_fil_post_rev_8_21_14_2_50_50_13]PIY54740.1 MAG: hypothetical protein COZ00_13230 [Zetaproteobacteria bacterium CG_4_10_14_0_8_um_filter_49_80]PJA34129.1 MAG: hypothetical protein CO186_11760 [Zetaproteobacteria bacterium CG_4_9_14_3_um_filter_49_83]
MLLRVRNVGNSSASIGIAFYPNDADNQESLIKNADAAMYFAKQNGRDCVSSFQSEDR